MKLITNIHQLLVTGEFTGPVCGKAMSQMPYITNAYLIIEEDRIYDFGPMEDLPPVAAVEIIDATGKIILPMWCDSHTHLVYATGREDEFVDRINGLSYEEIANRGGGILNSVARLRSMSEDALYEDALKRLQQLIALGTGAIEIKSGYGLSVAAEKKMLRVIARLKAAVDIPIKATLLAAHAIPTEYKENRAGYVQLIIEEMIPAFAKAKLCDFIDVFCESGYFTVAEMEAILTAGKQHGLRPKVHVNQFNAIGGIAAAVNHDALSVDHLEELAQEDIEALQGSNTIPVALPGCSFFLSIPYTPARRLIDAGLPLAIATDYNPGSAPSGNMNFTVAQASIQLRMTPEEAIIAATINGAFAMDVASKVGSITKGKKANLIITTPQKSYNTLPYRFGYHQIDQLILNGELL
ncbi:imidazolonepropionase [Dokdonia ponticola]|uniref:Imidazolonepropionase n=1 Tax=Dokdonia ponticola TaxID=2041041 RepID=A0ABV9HYW7_9FLAO